MAKKQAKQPILALDPVALRELKKVEAAQELGEDPSKQDVGLLGLILKSLKDQGSNLVAAETERMSFEVDPQTQIAGSMGIYRLRQNLTPTSLIKKITGPGGDELINAILTSRGNHIASFGRPRTDRFSIGFDIQDMDMNEQRDETTQKEIQDRITEAKKILWQCGKGALSGELTQTNMSQFLKMATRDGLSYGSIACERLWWTNPKTGNKELYAWRASDSGTMYNIIPAKEQDQSIRAEAIRQLSQLKNKKFDAERYKKDEYQYVQVINGKQVQAFTQEEMVIYNLYPTTNVEYNGYPLTPIDQALNAITTHINITMHNKLYFQHGRAAKGMLVFKSDGVDEAAAQRIRLQFHQSINSVQNSWRMPVFGISADDDLSWQSIDTSGRDAEFQYLMDNNARTILSAFQMSPEELPGSAHLARGTNTQALSESDNEWKLTAARDVGLRPLVHDIQDFLNTHIFPFVDPVLAKTHKIVLCGLEKDSPEKENTRLQQDMSVHLTYNDIMKQVEKNPIATELGGDFPLNPQLQAVMDKYLTVGIIMENFLGIKGAAQDPRYQYIRDPLYFQAKQLDLQKAQIAIQQQMQVQQQMQQQAMMQQQAQSGQPDQNQDQQNQELPQENQEDVSKVEFPMSTDYMTLEKSISNNHNTITKMLLKRHQKMVDIHMNNWKNESKRAILDLEDVIKKSKKE